MLNQLTITYPPTLPDFLQVSRDTFEPEAKLAMVVKLFEMKQIICQPGRSLGGPGPPHLGVITTPFWCTHD